MNIHMIQTTCVCFKCKLYAVRDELAVTSHYRLTTYLGAASWSYFSIYSVTSYIESDSY